MAKTKSVNIMEVDSSNIIGDRVAMLELLGCIVAALQNGKSSITYLSGGTMKRKLNIVALQEDTDGTPKL